MESSILISTKKILGVASDDTSFDLDILTHINSAFTNLTQVGIGPVNGFRIEDEEPIWADFLGDETRMDALKSYVYLYVRMLFDPPATSYLIGAYKEQMTELIWRLNVIREGDEWADPNPPVAVIEDE